MDWTKIKAALEKGLTLVSEVAPIAAAAGPVGAMAGGIISKVAGFAASALDAADKEDAVLNSSDLEWIRAAQKEIQAANDLLAAQIAKS